MEEFYFNDGTPWSSSDLEYLREWYFKISLEEMSFALGRNKRAVCRKSQYLIEKGQLKKQKRIKKLEEVY